METGPGRRAARAPIACVQRAAAAALLAALLSGCMTSGPPAFTPVSAGAAPTVAFESIDGPPAPVFSRLVQNLQSEAEARQIAVVSRQGAANYRVRGYLAAQVVKGRTHISWVWDVYDGDQLRTMRISGEEAAGRAGPDAWNVADEAMLRKIARASMDRLSAMLNAPPTAVGGPYEPVPASPVRAAAMPR